MGKHFISARDSLLELIFSAFRGKGPVDLSNCYVTGNWKRPEESQPEQQQLPLQVERAYDVGG